MSKTVGNYTLVEKLGQGSYAMVYKAYHKTNGGTYAVKVISRQRIGSEKLQRNLEQEISIMKEVGHENVVRLFGTFSSKNNIYLVLEYCGGGDLQMFIRKHKRLEEIVALKFLVQLARGLKFLHSRNIIHRDIKPQNILLSEFSPNAIIKFADFGFAKHLNEASLAQTPCGTPLYMAPEIFEMKEYDAKADVWSIGCVLFEMCVGEPPFKGSNHRELYKNIQSNSMQLSKSVVLSSDVTAILQRLLELKPERRVSLDKLYQVTERLAVDLDLQATGNLIKSSISEDTASMSDLTSDRQEKQNETTNSQSNPLSDGSIKTKGEENAYSGGRGGGRSDLSSSFRENKTNVTGSGKSGNDNYSPRKLGGCNSINNQVQSHQMEGQSIRRVRSREKVQDRQSPTSSLSTPLQVPETSVGGSIATACSMSPATTTMVVKLSKPGSSPNSDRGLSEHARVGGSSVVSKALSSPHASDDETDQQLVGNKVSTTHTGENAHDGSRYLRSSPAGSIGRKAIIQGESPNPTYGTPPAAFGRDSDDFVVIDDPTSEAFKSQNNANSTASASKNFGHSDSNGSSRLEEKHIASPSPSGNFLGRSNSANSGPAGNGFVANSQQQSSEVVQLSQCSQRCQYITSVVAALTKHADSLVKDILVKYNKTISRELDRDAIMNMGKNKDAGVCEEDAEDRDRELSPRNRSSTSSSGGDSVNMFSSSNQQLNLNLKLLSDALCIPFSLYLHSMHYVQDAIKRTASLKDMPMRQHNEVISSFQEGASDSNSQHLPVPSSHSAYFLKQLETLVSGLAKRLDQLLGRAESCKKWIRVDATYPIPEPLIYQAALKLGQEAALQELLGNLSTACDHYWDAKLLVECVLYSASEAADRRVLQGYAKMFLDQYVLCEKSISLLDYDRGSFGRSNEYKFANSPGSNSSFDSHVSLNSNTPNQNYTSK